VQWINAWLADHERVRRWLTLFRLSLFQFGLGMALAPITGTLNRVLIDELSVPAVAVAWLISLHYFVSPIRTVIGFQSDVKRSQGRWRTPYVVLGGLLTYGGLACAPFALILMNSVNNVPFAVALISCTIIFLAYGIGVNIVETSYLALVSDITPPRDRGRVLGLLWIMLVFGTIVSSILIGWLLQNYSHFQLIRVMQGSAVIFLAFMAISMYRTERLRPDGSLEQEVEDLNVRLTLGASVRVLLGQRSMRNLFLVLFLATLAFSVHDVLLEPYGGQVLGMSIAATTGLTAIWGVAMMVAIATAGVLIWKNVLPVIPILLGCMVGAAGFAIVTTSVGPSQVLQFESGVWLIGMGRGLFIVGSLALVMTLADRGHIGLFLGLWGMTQALAQGFGTIGGGLVRDLAEAWSGQVATGYLVVYSTSVLVLLTVVALIAGLRLGKQLRDGQLRSPWAGLRDVPGDQLLF
jgi:BCD family chlorophyll transporter-like MFS transporter